MSRTLQENKDIVARWKIKQKLLGYDNIVQYIFQIGGYDNIRLCEVKIKNLPGNGNKVTIYIPEFVEGISGGAFSGVECDLELVYSGDKIKRVRELFSGYMGKSIDMGRFNTKNVTDMNYLFGNCKNLKHINIDGINTSKLLRMPGMFSGTAIEYIDISKINTSEVTDMSGLFRGCTYLKEVYMGGMDTSNVWDMNRMFMGCINLENICLKGIDTSGVNDMAYMFRDCESLYKVDLSSFSTSAIIDEQDIHGMFVGCTSLDFNSLNTNDRSLLEEVNKYKTGYYGDGYR